MSWLDSAGLLAAVSAATLGGLALAYARFVWTHGNGLRRFMRWLAPLWSLVSFWYAAVWTADAMHPEIDTATWLRPVAWLVFAIPAFVLVGALVEDTAHREQERRAEKQLNLFWDRMNRG